MPHIKMFHNGMKIREETGFPGPTDLRKWVDDALPPPTSNQIISLIFEIDSLILGYSPNR